MSGQLTATGIGELLEKVVVHGDLSKLTAEDRVRYYAQVCESLGLNPLTKPFDYLELDRKLVLYARKECTDQLRVLHSISIEITDRKPGHGTYTVTARAKTPDGRTDEASGVVALEKEEGDWKTNQNGKRYFQGNGKWAALKGDALANAFMKAETKAKRRVTLSICGLGVLDESEIETIPGAAAPPAIQPAPEPPQEAEPEPPSPQAKPTPPPQTWQQFAAKLDKADKRFVELDYCAAGVLTAEVMFRAKGAQWPEMNEWTPGQFAQAEKWVQEIAAEQKASRAKEAADAEEKARREAEEAAAATGPPTDGQGLLMFIKGINDRLGKRAPEGGVLSYVKLQGRACRPPFPELVTDWTPRQVQHGLAWAQRCEQEALEIAREPAAVA